MRRTAVQSRPPREPGAALRAKAAKAFLIAKDSVANLLELLEESSHMAFLAIKDCERELDTIEREIDEELPAAITRVSERKARELIASLRFITDLERIGDLIWWIAQRLKNSKPKLQTRDTEALAGMARHIASMLEAVHQGLLNGDTSMAQAVIVRDRDIDELRQQVFRFHLDHKRQENTRESIEILFMTQALERAGDHATNLAEELIHLHEERSVRHLPKKTVER
jgi:phosphate transport system protein